jgi:hypothetical protein
MTSPSVRELSSFLADLAERDSSDRVAYAELMSRKADLLERIAAEMTDDAEAAEVAALARARADRLKADG